MYILQGLCSYPKQNKGIPIKKSEMTHTYSYYYHISNAKICF